VYTCIRTRASTEILIARRTVRLLFVYDGGVLLRAVSDGCRARLTIADFLDPDHVCLTFRNLTQRCRRRRRCGQTTIATRTAFLDVRFLDFAQTLKVANAYDPTRGRRRF